MFLKQYQITNSAILSSSKPNTWLKRDKPKKLNEKMQRWIAWRKSRTWLIASIWVKWKQQSMTVIKRMEMWHCHGTRHQIQDNKYLSKWDIGIMTWVSCLKTNYFCKSTYLTLTCVEQGVTAETGQYITPVSFYLKYVVNQTSMVFSLITPLTSDAPSVDGFSGHLCLWEGPCGGTECRIITQLIATC